MTAIVLLVACTRPGTGTTAAAKTTDEHDDSKAIPVSVSVSSAAKGRATAAPPVATTPERKRKQPNCPRFVEVPLLESYWFMVVADFAELNRVILHIDNTDIATPVAEDGNACGSGQEQCSPGKLGHFWSQDAEWQYMRLQDKVVASRQTLDRASRRYALTLKPIGRFVIGVLHAPDYSCPANPDEECVPYTDPEGSPELGERMVCESYLSRRCVEDGMRGTIEVLDVGKSVVYRIEKFRRLKQKWKILGGEAGPPGMQLDECLLELP